MLLKATKTRAVVDVAPEKAFWVRDGQVLKNLKDLAVALEKMSEATFKYHVTKEKNDFTKWVKDVFGDEKLAKELSTAKTAKAAANKVKVKI